MVGITGWVTGGVRRGVTGDMTGGMDTGLRGGVKLGVIGCVRGSAPGITDGVSGCSKRISAALGSGDCVGLDIMTIAGGALAGGAAGNVWIEGTLVVVIGPAIEPIRV